jgi:hypothetical protein
MFIRRLPLSHIHQDIKVFGAIQCALTYTRLIVSWLNEESSMQEYAPVCFIEIKEIHMQSPSLVYERCLQYAALHTCINVNYLALQQLCTVCMVARVLSQVISEGYYPLPCSCTNIGSDHGAKNIPQQTFW